MNFLTRTALPLFLLSSTFGYTINAMQTEGGVLCKNLPKKELILGISELPHELKLHIISLAIQCSISNFQLYKTINPPHPISAVAFSPKGEHFLTGHQTNDYFQIELWNIQTEKVIQIFTEHSAILRSAAFSPDEETILTGSQNATACVWSTKTGQLITTFTGHTAPITSVAFSPKGEHYLTGARDTTACLWDAKTGHLITTFEGHKEPLTSVAYSPDGEIILTGSYDNTARLWNVKTGKLIRVLKVHSDWINSVAFSPDGEGLLTGSKDGTTCLWDSKTGDLLTTFGKEFSALWQPVKAVAFSPDGKIAVTGTYDAVRCPVYVWKTKTGKLLQVLNGHSNSVYSVAFNQEGTTILTGSLDKTACVWRLVYGFSCLTEENKKKMFKKFMSLYPILHGTLH